MKPKDIKKGDIVTYRSGRINRVNKPFKYERYFTDDFKNENFGSGMDIVKIERYVKFLWFYKLKTIYERKESEKVKYRIGDLVQIRMDKVNEEFKKYTDIYTIEKVRKTSEGIYIYKLKGVPNWGTEDMIIPVNKDKK